MCGALFWRREAQPWKDVAPRAGSRARRMIDVFMHDKSFVLERETHGLIHANKLDDTTMEEIWNAAREPRKTPTTREAPVLENKTIPVDLEVTLRKKRGKHGTKQGENEEKMAATSKPAQSNELQVRNIWVPTQLPVKDTSSHKQSPTPKEEVIKPPLPLPKNGKMYTSSECVEIAWKYTGVAARRTVSDAMLDHGFASSLRQVQKLLEFDEKGLLPSRDIT